MRNEKFVNEAEVRKTLAIMKPNGQPYEVRVFGSDKKKTLSGYFHDADTLIKAFDLVDLRDKNVYITLNTLKKDADKRIQADRFMNASVTTSDSDIEGFNWLFIDVDPVRLSGISSSDDELQAAAETAGKVYTYMKSVGFEDPVKAMSGNGCHLLYRISLANTAENKELVHACLNVLSMMFDNEKVKIDTVNFNPARICKLHGTLAQKGSNSPERPFRMSRIFTNSLDVKVNPKVFLEKLAAEIQQPDEPEEPQRVYRAESFNLIDFMAKHDMTYREVKGERSEIYLLDHCPFDESHVDGDSKIFLYSNGAIAFKCHHNSCRAYRWQDVRKKFDPDYGNDTETDRRIEEGYRQHNRMKSAQEVPCEVQTAPEEMFRTAMQIQSDPEPDHEFIKSGITAIDNLMKGFEKTAVSVISGLRGCGKSTLIGQITLNAIEAGHTVVCYSGELNNKKYLNWLIRQAAGKTNVERSAKFGGGYGVNDEIQNRICSWMGDRLWLYNNRFGNRFDAIAVQLQQVLAAKRADLCIIDNMMALDLSAFGTADKYEAQKNFVWKLKDLADRTNTHIIFVAHPRKASGFLRLVDIAGSGDIANIVDNAFIVHRWNHDFMKGYNEEYKHNPDNDIPVCSNVIEITKDREGGKQDIFVPLYYEESTKRLRNSMDEYVSYSWDTGGGYTVVNDEEVPW